MCWLDCEFDNSIILQIRLMQDRETGESKGYAFIGFKSKEDAQKAIEELHNKAFKVMIVLHIEKFTSISL